MKLKIITPKETVFEKDVDFVLLRTTRGDKGVLPGHEPYVALLADGVVKTFVNKIETDSLAVLGGFATINNDEVVILSELAAERDKIGELISEVEKNQKKRKRDEQVADLEVHRAEEALRRALVNMEINLDSIIKENHEHDIE